VWAIPLSLCFAAALAAQSLEIRSEFQRVDPFGQVVAADRTEHPREILSPAVARNAWTSFQITATIPENTPSFLYVQQKPEFFELKLYKELYVRTPGGWVPDPLRAENLPAFLFLPDPEAPIPGQAVVTYWLDVWVPERTPAGRMRMQAVLKSGDRWVISPMEVRVMEAAVPKLRWQPGRVAPVAARADASACAINGESAPPETIRQSIRRNAVQYTALAHSLGTAASWCQSPGPDPEWFLRAREKLFKLPVQ